MTHIYNILSKKVDEINIVDTILEYVTDFYDYDLNNIKHCKKCNGLFSVGYEDLMCNDCYITKQNMEKVLYDIKSVFFLRLENFSKKEFMRQVKIIKNY